jgi:hypothetical protein
MKQKRRKKCYGVEEKRRKTFFHNAKANSK